MSAFTRVTQTGYGRVHRAAAPVDFTEALLLVALALGAKAIGLW